MKFIKYSNNRSFNLIMSYLEYSKKKLKIWTCAHTEYANILKHPHLCYSKTPEENHPKIPSSNISRYTRSYRLKNQATLLTLRIKAETFRANTPPQHIRLVSGCRRPAERRHPPYSRRRAFGPYPAQPLGFPTRYAEETAPREASVGEIFARDFRYAAPRN